MKKVVFALTALAFLSAAACGGSDPAPKDASDTDKADQPAEGKSLEKFEGNRMEKADEEE
jgi:hypothetical protein